MVLKISARQIFSIVTLVTLFCSAHAELIDESKTLVMTEGQAKEYYARTFAARDASWRVRPIISVILLKLPCLNLAEIASWTHQPYTLSS